MESVKINIDPEKEELVPRPDAPDEVLDQTEGVLERAELLFEQYRQVDTGDLLSALEGMEETEEMKTDEEAIDFGQFVPKVDTGDDEE
jgi:flagellar protein FlaI